jgi:hypothetical protein
VAVDTRDPCDRDCRLGTLFGIPLEPAPPDVLILSWRNAVQRPPYGQRVARELDAIVARSGRPTLIVSDHGTAIAMLAWTAS